MTILARTLDRSPRGTVNFTYDNVSHVIQVATINPARQDAAR